MSHLSHSDSESNHKQTHPQIVPCRLCGQPIEVVPWDWNGKDMSIITCDNPKCGGYQATFTVRGYATRDMDPYR